MIFLLFRVSLWVCLRVMCLLGVFIRMLYLLFLLAESNLLIAKASLIESFLGSLIRLVTLFPVLRGSNWWVVCFKIWFLFGLKSFYCWRNWLGRLRVWLFGMIALCLVKVLSLGLKYACSRVVWGLIFYSLVWNEVALVK